MVSYSKVVLNYSLNIKRHKLEKFKQSSKAFKVHKIFAHENTEVTPCRGKLSNYGKNTAEIKMLHKREKAA